MNATQTEKQTIQTRLFTYRFNTDKPAEAERDGFLWLMDNGINTENWIYYDHTGRFCYGWRKPVSAAELSAFLDVASEFPFPYDVKTEDGRTLSAER